MPSISEDYLVPIIVGATSEKGANADMSRLCESAAAQMARLRNTFPNSPFLVISTLGGKADRVFAELAVDLLSAGLKIILPRPRDVYLASFPDDDRRELAGLLEKADQVIDIASLLRQTGAGALPNDENVNELIAAAFIAEHSEILFTVSENRYEDSEEPAARIVKWMREGGYIREYSIRENKSGLGGADKSMIISFNPGSGEARIEYVPAEEPDAVSGASSAGKRGASGSVYDSLSSRLFVFVGRTIEALDGLYDRLVKSPEAPNEDTFGTPPFIRIIGSIDGFNLDTKRYFEKYGGGELLRSRQYLLQDESDNGLVTGDKALTKIVRVYTAADALSQYYQKKTTRIVNWIYLLFFAAVVLYGLIDLSSYLVLFYIGLIPAIALLVKKTAKDRLEDRYLDYRALAEGLRVEVFWTLSGVNENVSSHYMSKYEGLLTWIRKAVRSVEVATLSTDAARETEKRRALDMTEKLWIDSQLGYFSSKKKPLLVRSQQFGNVVFLSFVLTLIVALVYGMYVLAAGVENGDALNRFQVLLGAIAAVGVGAQAYKNKKAYDELERRYELARQTYASAKRGLESGTMRPERILVAVGREALMENSDWLWTHRSLPIEVPKG